MNPIKRYNEIMGPKDERLEAEENKAMKASAYILLAGTLLALWYAVSLRQVADVTGHPIFTPLGESLMPVETLLVLTVLVAALVSGGMQIRSGVVSSHTRYAEVDSIPWDFVAMVAVLCGLAVGVLGCGMRIVAEIQIVGAGQVMWFGDIAIGAVLFGMGFALGLLFMALSLNSAIKRRKRLEQEMGL